MNQIIIATDGRDDSAARKRFAILQRNREVMEHHFVHSEDRDIAFLIFELSPQMTLPADVASFVVKSVESQMIPTQIVKAPRWTIYKVLRKFQRELHRVDRRDPKESQIVEQLRNPAKPNHFWAVVVAQKGKQIVEYSAPEIERAR